MVIALVAFFVAAAATSSGEQFPGSGAVIAGLGFYITCLFLPLLVSKSPGWLHPTVFVVIDAFKNLVRGFALYTGGLRMHVSLPEYSSAMLSDLVAFELTLSGLGVIAYTVGYIAARRAVTTSIVFRRPRNVALMCAMWVTVAVSVAIVYLTLAGGITAYMVSWQYGRHEALAGQHIWFAITRLAPVACWPVARIRCDSDTASTVLDLRRRDNPVAVSAHRESQRRPNCTGCRFYRVGHPPTQNGPRSAESFSSSLAPSAISVLGGIRSNLYRGEVGFDAALDTGLSEEGLDEGAEEASARATSRRG